MRERYVAEVNRVVDQAIAQIQKSERGACYQGYDDAPTAGAAGGGGTPSSSPSSPKGSESSGTNNQVAGVDEADFVKNDGQYLYIVANGALRILKAFPAKGDDAPARARRDDRRPSHAA